MEDKTFELLTQLYNALSNFREETNSRFNQVDCRLAQLDSRFDKVEKRLDKLEFTIENDMKPDIKATLDGYRQLAEGKDDIKTQLADLSSKVDNQEVEITAIKRVK